MDEAYPRDKALGDIVAAHAARTPAAPAVIFGSECLSYAELNRRANRLARHLRAAGAGAGARVATCLDRSADMVVAWLAIVKAGAAYVPLDPDYPRERVRFMLEDSAASAVITTARCRPLLPDCTAVVSLDEDRDAIAAHDDTNLSCGVGGGWVAHVIYTSGSTGRPKGVCIPHRAVSRLVLDTIGYTIEPSDRVSQTANAAFDAATFEIWGALLNGACLVGIPREVVLSPLDLIDFVREREINVLFLTTALFNLVVGANPRAFAGLRAVFTGGEAMSPRCARDVLAAGAPGQLVNAYGPTENAVFTTCQIVQDVPAGAAAVPIGQAVNHTDVCVLDENLELVPPGMPGELCTGGDGLADGYWNRPDVTAAHFIPHPLSATPGARLYRTGDRARQSAGGVVEFLGRVDEQVKVRGHRIEPGEVEAALLDHPAVAEALVLAREDRPGEKRLVAYVRHAGLARPSATELRAFIADRLPAYMIPAAFVVLDAMPLTAGGKIDRRALPVPASTRPALAEAYVAPRTPVEETLAGLWTSVLGVSELGVHDDFLELGGHSLLAAQVMTRVNDTFAASLPLGTIFERPTVARMAERLAAIDRVERAGSAPVAKASRSGPLPLAFSQEQVWFLNELEPGNLAYNFQSIIRFTGALDVVALERTLEEIVRRHEILRTAFVTIDGRPAQTIAAPMPLSVPLVDLRHLPEDDRAREAERWFAEQCQTPFDLQRPPLARWTLLRTGDDEHVLIHVEHHLVHDGWSFSVMLREMKTIYQAFSKGEPSPLADPAWQFADYAAWQRATLQGDVLDEKLAFWRRALAGAPSALDLPADRPRPETLSFRGGGERFEVPTGLYAALRTFSRQEKVTLFMTMVAAFKMLLWRYTGQEDIVIGSGMANRPRREFESVLGMFVNPVVMRTSLAADPTFRELVQRVRTVALDAYTYQDTPFGKLVETLQIKRDPSRNPLFQVLFSFHDAAVPDLAFDGLTGAIVERHNGSAKFDLNVICIPRAEQRAADGAASESLGLTVMWEYNTDLFDRATAVRLFHEYQNLLGVAASRPDVRMSDLPFLAHDDRRRILVEWNDTRTAYPEPHVLHALLAAQARRTPDAIALTFEDRHLTYRELHRRANQLARHLQRSGAGPETLVGVALERSLDMVVALVAILKAGAAYVPIDPDYPAERVAFMLADAGIPVLLTHRHLLAILPPLDARVIALDSEWDRIAAEPDDDVVSTAGPEHLAYVIYTSGSTGRPKAAMNTHRAIVNRLRWMQDALQLTADDRVLQKTPFSFDVSVWEFFWPLMVGARLVVARPGGHQDPEYLASVIGEQQITTLHFVPSMLRAFLDDVGLAPASVVSGPDASVVSGFSRTLDMADSCRTLKRTVCSGEALPVELQDRFFARLPGNLYNLYGPTEAAVDVTWWRCDPADSRRTVPIGHPIANTQMYVLDRHLQPVPAGAPGELHIGGAGLGRGYLNRPDTTADRFIPDPLGDPGGRLYKTGDLARYLSDGAIEFLGRIDHQVKVRGFRIELGEIESRLREHPLVRDAVVVARTDAAADTRLIAYVVAAAEESGAASEPLAATLRTHLERALPHFMIPGAIVQLDVLPLSPNGKIDRRALPDPPSSIDDEAFIAPRTELESQIADIWKQVLGVDRVGARDYFFDLGGHSLKTVQIRSRLSQELGVDLPLRAAFEHPTVEQQAQLLSSLRTTGSAPTRPAIPRLPDEPHYPLSRAQRRLWFLHQLDPDDGFYNRPIRVALRGRLDRGRFERAFDRLVERHEVLRTRFGLAGDEPVQSIVEGFRVPVEVHDLSAVDDGERPAGLRSLLSRIEPVPFTLDTPPVRALLCRLGGEHHLFVIVLHHIATDGWSGQLLIEDLAGLYLAECRGVEPDLPPAALRYVDFAGWQAQQPNGGAPLADEEYWTGLLVSEPPQIELPSDGCASGADAGEGRSHTRIAVVECSAADGARLAEVAQQHGVTSFMLRAAMLKVFLSRFTGQTDVVIGTPVAGRPFPELERIAGFFANTVALRTDLSGDPSFSEALERVRRTALDAYAHEAYPFDLLIERLNPVRDADRMPLLQVLFTVEPTLETRTVERVTFEAMPDIGLDLAIAGGAAYRTGKLDLTVSCVEKPDGRLAWVFLLDSRRSSETSVRRLGAAFETFVAALVERPDSRLSQLPVVPASERRRVLTEWNATDAPYDAACVHELVAAQVRRTPDAIAVVCGAGSLTFAELDRRANWMAHRLRAQGIGPDALVGVYLERSLDLVIALLATLKAGGAYLPLDPNYPRARLEWMLADGSVSVVLTSRALRDRLPGLDGVEVWALDDVWRDQAARADAAPMSGVTPRHLAYAIYTSGSTGTAKGVDIAHAGVSAFLHAMRDRFTPEDRSGLLASTSICFDLSVFEIFMPLAWGGTVILVENALHAVPAAGGVPVTMINTVPSAMAELVRGGALPASLRVVNLAGEPLQNHLVQQVYAQGVARVFNLYGPTETTTYSTFTLVPRGATENPTVGRPIANTRVYVLDTELEPVPIGAVGELYIGGAGLARGYHRRPDLTAERFVPDPFAPPGARMYRTGDRVRYRFDGDLEFLGRADHQAKLRGFRIEPGEIEAALLTHGTLRDAVVLVREDTPGDKRLVAYVVRAQARRSPAVAAPDEGDAAFAGTLRRFLEAKLPSYMVPAAIVILDALPRQPNGKINRTALPAPALPVDRERVRARTDLERQIAAIWEDVLGLGPIGIDDNVFELGAHSLMAAKAHRRIQDALVVQWAGAGGSAPAALSARIQRQVRELVAQELPLRAMFDCPTVRTLAASLAGGADDPPEPSGPEGGPPRHAGGEVHERGPDAIEPVPVRESYPLSHAQRRIWLMQRLDPTGSAYNVVFPLRLAGTVDACTLEGALQQVVDRHESLRTTFGLAADGEPVQRIAPHAGVPFAFEDLSALSEADRQARVRDRLLHAARTPFDLEAGPLVRAELLQAGDREHWFLVVMHHLVTDGRSWDVVFDEMVTAYGALRSGAAPAFAKAGARYVDYVAWDGDRLSQGRLADAEAYWRRRFADGIPELALPVDHPDPRVRTFGRHRRVAVFDRATADRLRDIGRRAGATSFIVYLSVLAAFLRRLTGQHDLVVGTPVAGRDHPDLDRVVGCFINTVLVRSTLGGDPRFADLLAHVRGEAVDAYASQAYPLDVLAQQLNVTRGAGRTSLVQVLFATADPVRPRAGADVEFAMQPAEALPGAESEASLPAKFDFHAGAIEAPDGRLTWVLGFSADLFEPATASRIARRFETFVADLASRPEAALSAFQLLGEAEREELRLCRAADRREYPLSFNQREMWAQCQFNTGGPLHNVGVEVVLDGPLDVDLFREALQAVIDRHEAMRTGFPAPDGTPVQRVENVRVEIVLRDDPDARDDDSIESAYARDLGRQPFDLDRPPLFRAELVRFDRGRHVFVFVFHHLILDAYHLSQLLEELARTYERYIAGDRRPLPPLPLQFGDFAIQEERRFNAGLLAHQQHYWRGQMRAPVPSMAIPGDRQSIAARTFDSGCFVRRLPRDLVVGLKGLKGRYRTTSYRTILAAFEVLLWRLTGEADVLLAMPFSTRPDELGDAIGFFANTLPLRATLDVDRPFHQLIADVTAQVDEARTRCSFPLTEALRGLDLQRDLNRAALPVCISQVRLFSTAVGELRMKGRLPFSRGSAFDLWLALGGDQDDILVELHYAAELFNASTIAAFANALEALLRSIVANPESPIRALEMVMPPDRALVGAWGDGGPPFPVGSGFSRTLEATDAPVASVVAEIDAVARRTPDALAVTAGEERWTYSELNAAANALASALCAAGAGREARVGILGTRSPGMLATVIGTLKAGAAFVPLEANLPDARLHAILQAAGVTVVASDRASRARVDALAASLTHPPSVLCWDENPPGCGIRDPGSATPDNAANLAYIFYTSGSTGTPKGVMVEQGAMRNHLRAKIATLGLDAASVVVQNASYGFDIIVWQWLAPLLAGGRVVIYDEATAENPAALLEAVSRDGATVLETVPGFLEALTEAADARASLALPALQWVVSNAEALPGAIARRWLARYPAVRLLNTYGATECADDTTHREVTLALAAESGRVSVGRPIPGVRVAVVDEALRPVPPACVGEILLGGVAVGRGYLGDAAATAQAFVPDPVSGVPGARMYRTGDRGRWTAGGELECLGRQDDQVKVHGYRVELGEVEAALAALPDLSQVAAAVRTDARGQRRLVAYYVSAAACDAVEVRRALAGRLPAYMVPDAVVRLGAMPRTRTGKLDRAALPQPPLPEPASRPGAPATPLEATLAEVWQQVLKVPHVGPHDNFFDLGGDSIQSILVVSRLNQRGFRLSPRAVFAHQTVAELARVVERSDPSAAEAGRPATPAPLLPLQQAFFDRRLAEPHHWNQAVLLRAPSLDVPALRRAVQALVDRHAGLRLRFFERDGRWLQQAPAAGEAAAFDVIDLDGSVDGAVDNVRLKADATRGEGEPAARSLKDAATRVQASLDIERGPVFRAALMRQAGADDRLLLAAHHLVIDTVSWGVLVDDLERAYDQASAGQPIHLWPETTTYAQWAEALSSPADRFTADLPYWQAIADGCRPLPRDDDRDSVSGVDPAKVRLKPDTTDDGDSTATADGGANTFAASGRVRAALRPDATRRLLTGGRRAFQADITDLLLTAFARVVGPWTGEPDVTLYLEGHGREDLVPGLDLSRTTGWFTAVYPVRLDTGGEPAAHLTHVRDTLDQVPHHGLGYGVLRWTHRRLVGREPEISFNYHGQLDRLTAGDRFRVSRESAGEASSPRNTRPVPINVECGVLDGRLHVECVYSRRTHHRETIERLAQAFVAELDRVVTLCDDAGLPADAEDVYPLAPIQEGMLFHALFEPDSSLYYEQAHFALDGPLNVAAFHRAWNHVVSAHPILRTVIRWEGRPEPVQVVLPHQPAPMRIVDLQHLPAQQQQSLLARDADDEWADRFSLDIGPLVRLALFVLGPERFHFTWSFHHILLDGWSVTSILRDLARGYEALLEHQPPAASPARPYRDFVSWLRAQDRREALEFWRRELDGFDSPTPLPRDRHPAGIRRREADAVDVAVAPAVTRALERWTRAERVTMSALLRAAWAIVLARFSGTTDLLFGATVSGRPAEIPGVEQMVGAFINAVPVRVSIEPSWTVAEIVRHVHAQSVEAGAFEYVPLPDIQKACGIPAETQLFDSLFAYENFPLEGRPRTMGGVRIRAVMARELTHYDLTLLAMTADTIALRLSYATDVFDRGTAARIVEALATLLSAIAADPQARVSATSLMSAGDAARVDAWGDGGIAEPFRGVAGELAAAAARRPGAVAVVSGGVPWTYAQLRAAVDRMANALRLAGVGREVRVGLLGSRSPGMLATVIGTLHVGGAFVALEAGQPDARLHAIVQAAGVAVVVSDRASAGRARTLAAGTGARVLCWDDAIEEQCTAPALPAVSAWPADLAYIFFTSGSTGVPKGVMVEQRAMGNHLRAKIETLGLHRASAVAQNASYGFDIVVWQWLAPLLAGGRVVIYDDATADDPAVLLAALARDAVTVVETVPSFLDALAAVADGPAELPALEWMVSNAEALPAAVAARWQARYPAARLLNTYGATECADDTTHGEAIVGRDEDAGRVPVGRPIPGSTAAVVDEMLRPVPPGCVGEIVLGGVPVGRGYLGDPAGTAIAFVPDPRSAVSGGRLYRTGDRGRWRTNGSLECLGRQDDQVKVHGYRVELGEVEAALATLPELTQVAAAVRTDARGHQRLVAYYVAPAPREAAAVRKALAAQLPAYMVPDAIVRLDALPRTRTGKLDRAALPAPAVREAAIGQDAPLTPMEAAVAAVWQQVLQVPHVSRADNFFDLGGHSLTAIRIVAALKDRLGRQVPIRQLFLTPTVAELAQAIDVAPAEAAAALARVADRPWYPISSAQRAQWIVHQMGTGHEWHLPRVVQLDGELDRGALAFALQALVDRHDILRTTFAEQDGDVVQIVQERFEMSCVYDDVADLEAEARTARVRETFRRESRRPFDLSRLPLLEARLMRLEPGRHLLLLRLPHIITDGWTEGVLVADLAELYSAHHNGRPSSLPPPGLRYVDVSAREEEWLRTAALQSQKAYWLERFSGEIPGLELPGGSSKSHGFAVLPAGAAASDPVQRRAAFATAVVDDDTIAALRRAAAAHGATMFVALLGAFEVLLSRLSGASDLVVSTPVAGRGGPGLERVAGPFANVLPLRSSLAGNPRFADILRRVGETTLEGLAHQDYPFQRWLEELRRCRGQRDLQLSSAFFVVHEEAFHPAFDGLAARWHGTDAPGARLDAPSLPWDHQRQIVFSANAAGGGWRIAMMADASRFADASLERMLEQWIAIVRQVAADPERRLAEIELPAGTAPAYATVALDRDEIDHLFA